MDEKVDFKSAHSLEEERLDEILGGRANSPYFKHLGMKIHSLSRGAATIRISVGHRLWNVGGVVHGGAIASAAETAGSLALATLLDLRTARPVTVEMKVNFLFPLRDGILEARGKVVHKGRNIAVCDMDVYDGEKRLIARCTGTYKLMKID